MWQNANILKCILLTISNTYCSLLSYEWLLER